MTYPYTVLLEPDVRYTILSEDGSPVYVTFTTPRSESTMALEHTLEHHASWLTYNMYTGYALIALNIIGLTLLIAYSDD